MKTISETRSHGGMQGVYSHVSQSTKTEMVFSVYVPPHSAGEKLPVLWYLSGLTCTHANVTDKGEFRAACAKHKIIFIAPDTSPRGEIVPDDDAYDMGQGAGFYVDATQAPWSEHFHMRSYIERDLPKILTAHFPVDMSRQGITGHSMGGHGALTIGLRNPQTFASISAFAPIVNPMNCPWGDKALSLYLGDDKSTWRQYDACALIEDGARAKALLIDQGLADNFLQEQLMPERLEAQCRAAGIDLSFRQHAGYDHGYGSVSYTHLTLPTKA